MNERQQQLEAERSNSASMLATWRGFLEHPGWKIYEKILIEQRQNRILTVGLVPLESSAKIFAQEFMKGEAAGLGLAQTLPYAQLEMAESEVRVLNAKIEKENEDVQDETSARGISRVDDNNFST